MGKGKGLPYQSRYYHLCSIYPHVGDPELWAAWLYYGNGRPIFAPIGLGFWQIAVALIAGISAKEVVVSSCAVLFGIPNINSGAGMDTLVGILGAAGFGQLNAFCLMIFCLLYVPCAAALATIRKESGSTRWMLFSALFQLVVAWAVTFVVYRVGLLL